MTKKKTPSKGGRPRKKKAKNTAFAKWLKSSGTSPAQVSEDLECGLSSVYAMRDGSRTPGADMRIAIEDYTEGAVGFRDW